MEYNGGVAAATFAAHDSSTAALSRPASLNPSQGLPSVVILEIFQYLDLRSLLKCRLVSSDFQYLIDSTASLQYKIELAVAGQQDGSYGDMFTRREMLKMHQKRWDGLQWTEVLHVPQTFNRHWRLYGGVFAQASLKSCTVCLKRIPSQSRGIKEKNWILDLPRLLGKEEKMQALGMDLGQDLLVITASAGDDMRIHVLTLSKGEYHPLASEPSLHGAVVWNWKTGEVLMHTVSKKIRSLVFLNERYVLMAIIEDDPYLLAVDFLAEPSERRGLNELENYFIFRFPGIARSLSVNDIIVRSNIRSTLGADTDSSVPFSMVPQNRLLVVHLSTNVNDDPCFAILESSFLDLIKTGLRVNNHSFDWSMWGPEHSRALLNYPYSPPRLVHSHGTRLAMQRYLLDSGIFIDVYDFNQLGCRKRKQDSDVETPGNANVSKSRGEIIEGRPICVSAPTRIKVDVFRDEVDTRLGYSVTSWFVPGKTHAKDLICSEDAVILLDKMYEIYTV